MPILQEEEVETCMICYDIKPQQIILPCNHKTCTECFFTLISNNFKECPLCKNPFPINLQRSVYESRIYNRYYQACAAWASSIRQTFSGNKPFIIVIFILFWLFFGSSLLGIFNLITSLPFKLNFLHFENLLLFH